MLKPQSLMWWYLQLETSGDNQVWDEVMEVEPPWWDWGPYKGMKRLEFSHSLTHTPHTVFLSPSLPPSPFFSLFVRRQHKSAVHKPRRKASLDIKSSGFLTSQPPVYGVSHPAAQMKTMPRVSGWIHGAICLFTQAQCESLPCIFGFVFCVFSAELHVGSQLPDQGSNLWPLQWEH